MKKIFFAIILIAVLSPVFSQSNSSSSTEMYYINVPIEKIYPSSEGYIIMYRKSTNQIGTVGVPNTWFTEAAGRAEIMLLPSGNSWPSMSIFYRNGEFSHIRLYVHRTKRHHTWGFVNQGVDVSAYFSDDDTFNIEF